MTTLAVLAMALVAVHASVRILRPVAGDDGAVASRRDVSAVHGAMAVVMAAMLLVPLPGPASSVGALAFGAALAWCLVMLVRRVARGAYVRLGVACAAMVAMLVPAAAGSPAAAVPAVGAAAGDPSTSGMPGMEHAGHAHSADAVATGAVAVPAVLLVVLVVALAAVAVSAARRAAAPDGPGGAFERWLDCGCEIAMAGVMAAMLLVTL